MTRRLSCLQQRILRWLYEDSRHAHQATASTTLVKALDADKGNISKSLRNLEEKHCVYRSFSSGGYSMSVQLTPLGSYLASKHPAQKL
jgi:DNA-binding MarR family transcriptional regulator